MLEYGMNEVNESNLIDMRQCYVNSDEKCPDGKYVSVGEGRKQLRELVEVSK
jgi:hypothetical protein